MMSKASWLVMSFTVRVTRPPTFFPGTTLKSPCSERNLSTARMSICRRSSEIRLARPGRDAGFSGPASLCDSAAAGGLARALIAGWEGTASPRAGRDSDVSRSNPVISPATPKLTKVRPMEKLCPLEEIVFRVSITQDNSIPQDGLDANLVDGLPLFEERGLMLGRVFDHRDRDRSPRDPHQLQSFRTLPQDSERRRLRRLRRLWRLHGLRLCFCLLGRRGSNGIEEVPLFDLFQIVFHRPESR